MKVRAGYKQTEVGVIPKEWEVKRFSDCADLHHGFQFRDEHFYKDGIPVTKIGNLVDQGGLSFDNCTYVPKTSFKQFAQYTLKMGDVLMALTGATLGKVSVVDFHGCTLQNYRVGKFTSKENSTKEYVFYLLQSRFIQGTIKKLVNEAAQPNLGKQDFDKFIVPLPPTVGEQALIAKALNDVDALLAAQDKLIAKKRDIKQAAMRQLLTGKQRLPGFSGEWENKTIKSLVEIPVTDGPHLTPKFLDDGIPFLSVNNLVNNKIDLSDLRFISVEDDLEFSKKCKPRKDDLLLGKAASVGKVAIVETDMDFNIWSPIAMIRIGKENNSRFVYYQFQSSNLTKQIALLTNSSSQGNIGMGEIEKLLIGLPDYSEQTAIATVLSDMDAELAALEQQRDKTRALKQGMMQELLTGRIRLA